MGFCAAQHSCSRHIEFNTALPKLHMTDMQRIYECSLIVRLGMQGTSTLALQKASWPSQPCHSDYGIRVGPDLWEFAGNIGLLSAAHHEVSAVCRLIQGTIAEEGGCRLVKGGLLQQKAFSMKGQHGFLQHLGKATR